MKYAVIKVVNGTFSIHAEGFTTIESAKVTYHGLCQTLWNATDVTTAKVAIVDENLYYIDGCTESIYHEATTD